MVPQEAGQLEEVLRSSVWEYIGKCIMDLTCAQYQNDVYERLSFRVKFGFDYYEKISNETDTAISSLVGLGYDILPNLFCEVNIEANSNQRFDEDVRFGFQVAYNFHSGGAGRQRVAPLGQTRDAAFVPRRLASGGEG